MEEASSDGSLRLDQQKSLDKKLLEASEWGFSVVVVARFAKDSGLIGLGWDKLLRGGDARVSQVSVC